MTQSDINKTFGFDRITDQQRANIKHLMSKARELAIVINGLCPECREKSLALTAVQQALLWADTAVSIYGRENESVMITPADTGDNK